MKPVRPTAKAIAAALAKRDKLAADLIALDAAITAAGREWSRQQGNIVPLRIEALRRSVAAAVAEEAKQESSRHPAARSQGE